MLKISDQYELKILKLMHLYTYNKAKLPDVFKTYFKLNQVFITIQHATMITMTYQKRRIDMETVLFALQVPDFGTLSLQI